MNRNSGRRGNSYILAAMTSIAGQLGIRTLAEGVEKEDDLRFLQQIGCQYAQGFLFYRPMEAASSLPCWKKSRNYAEDCIVCR